MNHYKGIQPVSLLVNQLPIWFSATIKSKLTIALTVKKSADETQLKLKGNIPAPVKLLPNI